MVSLGLTFGTLYSIAPYGFRCLHSVVREVVELTRRSRLSLFRVRLTVRNPGVMMSYLARGSAAELMDVLGRPDLAMSNTFPVSLNRCSHLLTKERALAPELLCSPSNVTVEASSQKCGRRS